jgi:tRNA modification GTPase
VGLTAEVFVRSAEICREMDAVLAGARRGLRMREGVRVVIAGPPNVGKSSLMNALCSREIAIVSPIAGTTRDVVDARAELDGWDIILSDTAGLRDSDDPIEQAGVLRARQRIETADLVLIVSSWDVAEMGGTEGFGVSQDQQGVIAVRSKSDMAGGGALPGEIAVSSVTGEGVTELKTAIVTWLEAHYGGETALISRERQSEAMKDAVLALGRMRAELLPELSAEELRSACLALERLVGRVDVEHVLDRLFAGFCIGK